MTDGRMDGRTKDGPVEARAVARPKPRLGGGANPGLQDRLSPGGSFATVVELVSWAGLLDDADGRQPFRTAADLAGDARVAALSVTDNAGGHVRLNPGAPAEAFLALGHDVVVHVACRDRSRNALVSHGWDLLSRGLMNVLAVTGDYPVEGYGGLSRPVFDIDSVGLLAMYRGLAEAVEGRCPPPKGGPGGTADSAPHRGFHLGAVVDNHKRHERELIPQYLKLDLKIRSGARFIISQVGYDARKQDELLRQLARAGHDVPAIANAYILSRGVARAFHSGRIPGCVVTDELLALVEGKAASPDKGRAFFLELAAKQVAIARGLGYRGVYLSGHRDAAEVARVLDLAGGFGPDDWRTFAREIQFGQPDGFYLFERDPASGLNLDDLDRRYVASLTTAARRRARRRSVPLAYRADRLLHRLVFAPGSRGFELGGRFYGAVERVHAGRPLHVLEQAAKVPIFDCRDCGDCSLPDIAYLCPESHCAKNQRNGPCGGSHDGRCEVGDRECLWAAAYDRLKPYGEELAMLDRSPVVQDNALRRTSAWANTFLGRDHAARAREVAGAAAGPTAAAVAVRPDPHREGGSR